MNDVEHIAEIDKTLALLRESWLEARQLKDRAKWYLRINIALDSRLIYMRRRDKAIALSTP